MPHRRTDHPVPVTASPPTLLDLRCGIRRLGLETGSPDTFIPDAVAEADGVLLFGRAAEDALARRPQAGWSALLDRLGDPAPVLLGGGRHEPEELLAGLLAAELGPVRALWIVPPAGLPLSTWARLAGALERAGLPRPECIDGLELALGPCPERADAARVLIEVGRHGSLVRRCQTTPTGWRTTHVAATATGVAELDDAVVAFVSRRLAGRAGSSAGSDPTDFRRACSAARRRLAQVPAVEVSVPVLPPVRLVRADLDAPSAALAATVRPLVPETGDQVLLSADRVPPGLVQSLSAQLGRPVTLISDADSEARLRAAATPPAASPPATPDLAPLRPRPAAVRRLPARRLAAVAAVACSLATAGTALAVPQVREAAVRLLDPVGQAVAAQATALPAALSVATGASGTTGTSDPAAPLRTPDPQPSASVALDEAPGAPEAPAPEAAVEPVDEPVDSRHTSTTTKPGAVPPGREKAAAATTGGSTGPAPAASSSTKSPAAPSSTKSPAAPSSTKSPAAPSSTKSTTKTTQPTSSTTSLPPTPGDSTTPPADPAPEPAPSPEPTVDPAPTPVPPSSEPPADPSPTAGASAAAL